jgi:hypothetical protein
MTTTTRKPPVKTRKAKPVRDREASVIRLTSEESLGFATALLSNEPATPELRQAAAKRRVRL